MVNEVESILNEIRERVRSDHEPGHPAPVVPAHDARVTNSLVHGQAESGAGESESLSRLSAHLTTTARAWDRLPPLYSNRRGTTARLELWLKARLKSMSRWFTWEQVNFNSAVHHALTETLHALSAHQQELHGLRAELRSETESWRERFERGDRELSALRVSIETLTAEIRKQEANYKARSDAFDARSTNLEARSANTEAQAAELAGTMWKEIEATRLEITTRLAELAGELRESDQQLREEQRVCFKQLSLEASEVSVMEDRSRRAIESRLESFQRSVSKRET
jgi:small-conductance mechanosensitive channel